MNFELSPEQRSVRDLCREFAEGEVAPRAAHHDQTGEFPYELVRGMGKLGLFGLPFSPQHGGLGADFLSYCLAVEEISRGDASLGATLEAAVSLGIGPIYAYGTDAQKEERLPPLMRGEQLWAFGLTEPGAGSNASATATRARRENAQWVINGSKAFITNSGTRLSAGVTITALTGERDGHREISTIMVPRGAAGYEIAPAYRKLGWRASDTHGLSFSECRVPEENLLGHEGEGYEQFLKILTHGRIALGALSVGLARACLDAALQYAQERRQFGVPLSSFQAIQFKLADMATEIELARLMVHKAAWLVDAGRDASRAASMAKLYASEVSKRAADQALQIHGGNGFMEEFPVARYWRDVKINEIGEGTSEVQRILIARHLGLPSTGPGESQP